MSEPTKHGEEKRRLIDADALIGRFESLANDDWNKETGTTWANAFEESANMVDGAPTIDAVPVVRCRDCKHRYDDGYCEVWGDSFYYWEEFDEVPEDMFCGYGERREDGEEHNHDTD